MIWSKLRKHVRDRIIRELCARIDFHLTRYRCAHDQVGEAWITVDGVKVAGAGFYAWWKAYKKSLQATGEKPPPGGHLAVWEGHRITTTTPRAEKGVLGSGVYETGWFFQSLIDSLSLPLDEALASDNPLIRALALVDRRLGRRRFEALHVKPTEPDLVRLFHALRSSC